MDFNQIKSQIDSLSVMIRRLENMRERLINQLVNDVLAPRTTQNLTEAIFDEIERRLFDDGNEEPNQN